MMTVRDGQVILKDATNVRYKLRKDDIQYLTTEKNGGEEHKFSIRFSPDTIWVDILEIDGRWGKLRLHYSDGVIVTGWTWVLGIMTPLEISNFNQLFDGRFNSDAA